MSYDLRVWGRQVANLAECLLPSQGWTERDGDAVNWCDEYPSTWPFARGTKS